MTLSFIGIIFFCLEYLFFKHSRVRDYNNTYYKPLLPLWLLVVALLVNMIPVFNIISFICLLIFYLNGCNEKEIECNILEVKIVKDIYNFFTRSV